MVRFVMPKPRETSRPHTTALPTVSVYQHTPATMTFPNQPLDDLIDMLTMARFEWADYRRDVFIGCLALAAHIPDDNPILHDCLIRCAKYCQIAGGIPPWLDAFIEVLASARRHNGVISAEHLIPTEWRSTPADRPNQSLND